MLMSVKWSTWLKWGWIVTSGMPVHNAHEYVFQTAGHGGDSSHGLCLIATDLSESKS